MGSGSVATPLEELRPLILASVVLAVTSTVPDMLNENVFFTRGCNSFMLI
jgi:hypothetical protein